MTIITRRGALGLGAMAGLGLARPHLARAQGRSITVTALGGVWEEAVRSCFAEPYEKQTGNTARVLIGSPPQWLAQIEANPARPPIDAMVTIPDLAIAAVKNGLMDRFTAEKTPNIVHTPRQFIDPLDDCGVMFDYGVAGFTYNKDRIKQPPKSFVEFVDRTARGEWQASLPGIGYAVTPIMLIWAMARALGGGVDNVDPFFDAMRKMRRNVIFWNSPNDFESALATGDAEIGIYFDGRTWAWWDSGAKFAGFLNPSEGGSINAIAVQKPKNASEAVWPYLDIMLSAGAQLNFAKMLNYGVTNSQVVYPPELAARITPWQEAALPPYAEIAEKRAAWVDRWNREIGR
ncbi:extracellular solute-binding protein [Roseomonas marmotae]|uniref:Extracellular solute-binding protein n=1 Tax=Roseomonas marmotae TaxID=2768161 RepID=A0ABS3KAW2_9PROT|nr:extracellular solute-binding protein [Roseomonas marmotae]MBO1074580.1 extracellular solute-binding protein [Roseomonas marmotae]QTI81609.1 extracellular solute-binding protein [Roseomonas marmotae]